MDMFSLEDEDVGDMFITQTPWAEKDNCETRGILGEPTDFHSPCVSLLSMDKNVYLDISDDESFQIPSSQVNYQGENHVMRFVLIRFILILLVL